MLCTGDSLLRSSEFQAPGKSASGAAHAENAGTLHQLIFRSMLVRLQYCTNSLFFSLSAFVFGFLFFLLTDRRLFGVPLFVAWDQQPSQPGKPCCFLFLGLCLSCLDAVTVYVVHEKSDRRMNTVRYQEITLINCKVRRGPNKV